MAYIKILKAQTKHIPFLINGERSFIPTHGKESVFSLTQLKRNWNHPGTQIFVAEIQNKAVAYVMVCYTGDCNWCLNTIYTAKPFRQRGIIKKLFNKALVNISKKYTVNSISAYNLIDDVASDGALASVGFSLMETDLSMYNGRGGKIFKKTLK